MNLLALERPAVRLRPQPAQDRQLVLHEVCALIDLREGKTQLAVFGLVPARADADFDSTAAHLVDGGHNLGEGAGVAERDRRHQRSDSDARRLASDAGQHGPGVGGRSVRRAGEAAVVVRPKEGLEVEPFGQLRQLELLGVAESLLGLDHHRESHLDPPAQAPSVVVGHSV